MESPLLAPCSTPAPEATTPVRPPSPPRTRLAPSERCGTATRVVCACSLTQCPVAPPARGAIAVPLGVMAVSDDPAASLEVSALGSCIGLVLVDPEVRVAAMAHVFLPSSRQVKRTGCDRGKYADTVVSTLLEAVTRLGARRETLGVYLAGGGQLTGARPVDGAPTIGQANEAAVRERLSSAGLSATASRTGGGASRSMRVDVATGAVTTRVVGGELERL